MIRLILLFLLFTVVYHAVKTVIRSAREAYRRTDEQGKLPGAEMVLDPQCRTYILKDRSVTRRINGIATHFCSSECADKYEQGRR